MVVSETAWLIDKSAFQRLPDSIALDEWLTRIQRGLVRIATVTLLEVGFSARSADDWQATVRSGAVACMPVECLTPGAERRAVEVQGLLAQRGTHRAPSLPDLLLAAAAELGGLVVLHQDKDFELIAELTGQRVERLR